jgi:hypothetical protein
MVLVSLGILGRWARASVFIDDISYYDDRAGLSRSVRNFSTPVTEDETPDAGHGFEQRRSSR